MMETKDKERDKKNRFSYLKKFLRETLRYLKRFLHEILRYLNMFVRGELFSLDFFKAHWVFIAAIVVLIWISIANRYVCQTQLETIQELQVELTNAKTDRVRASARYMGQVRRSHITSLVEENHLGVVISDTPPIKIRVQNEDKK